MSFWSKLFGGGGDAAAPEVEAEIYKDFELRPAPMPEGGQFRLAGKISKGEKTHQLIRADLFPDKDQCNAAFSRKARQVIDEQGDRIFS
ncbi:HlyU family transcriptional regulator [Ahrensia sp. R2A130]|uniref:HlyU family transcriptional regulator n=1 Tax=Ahrensia sp. R2A130 TaxID=744979 RepID=UPI0001E08397|nr:HlyU family transcriptional regulator [Ahrensia sp. R2A130]EFL91051.1 transcriptional activator HlyU [Ahrensia sp. R2A130]